MNRQDINKFVKGEKMAIVLNGIFKENPVLALLLGLCPSLAVTTNAVNGLGMGLSATFVLILSNVVISLLKNYIPDQVRIPSYIVVIASFVTILGLFLKAYLPDLDKALGIYIPLIVVNCIILGRAEMFASKRNVADSALDGLGMGLGFSLALVLIGSIRELLGSGSLFGFIITANLVEPMAVFMLAPGGFFVLGCLVALINGITRGKGIKKKELGCESCDGCQLSTGTVDGGSTTETEISDREKEGEIE